MHAHVELEGCGDAVPCPHGKVAAPREWVEELKGLSEDGPPRDGDGGYFLQDGRQVLVLSELDGRRGRAVLLERLEQEAVEGEAGEAVAERVVKRKDERAVAEDGEPPEREVGVRVEAPCELGLENRLEVAEVVVDELHDAVEVEGRKPDPLRGTTASARSRGDSGGKGDVVAHNLTERGEERGPVDDVP